MNQLQQQPQCIDQAEMPVAPIQQSIDALLLNISNLEDSTSTLECKLVSVLRSPEGRDDQPESGNKPTPASMHRQAIDLAGSRVAEVTAKIHCILNALEV